MGWSLSEFDLGFWILGDGFRIGIAKFGMEGFCGYQRGDF